MRISERLRHDITTTRVEKAKSANTGMLEIMSTQKKLNKLSDNPVALGQAVREKDRINNMGQFIKNINFSKGYLERTETSVAGIHESLMRAKELAVAMSNDTYGPDSRAAAGREIKELIDGIVNLANTSYGNRFVFGGFRTRTPPLSNEGQYVGDDGEIFLQIGEDLFKKINVRARNLFEANRDERDEGHFNMIHSLKILHEGFMHDDQHMIRAAMEELDYQMEKTSSYQATLGAIHNALNSALERLEMGKEVSTETLSKLEDADIYKTMSDFKRTETILQSSLLASNKLLQPSLLNFLQ